MQNRNDILNELLEISRLMAESDNKASLYEVPANYFESFAGLIMVRIKNSSGSMLREIELLSPTISAIEKTKMT